MEYWEELTKMTKMCSYVIILLQHLGKINILFCAIKTTLTVFSNFIHHLPMILLRKKDWLEHPFLKSFYKWPPECKNKRTFQGLPNLNTLPRECSKKSFVGVANRVEQVLYNMCVLHGKHIDWNYNIKEKQWKFFKWVAQQWNAWTMNILHTRVI